MEKKYKLIKEYPGSPKLGTILSEFDDDSYVDSDSEKLIDRDLVDNFPELWQELIDMSKEQLDLEKRLIYGVGKLLLESQLTVDEFYDSRLKRTILTKEDIIKALEDWATISSMYEAKKYMELVENIRRKLPLHLQNEILKTQ